MMQPDFVQKGLSWAGDLAALSDIRTGLRERFARSAMGQPALVAAGLERALRIMWQRWCEGLPPVAIDVSDNQMIHETCPLENQNQRESRQSRKVNVKPGRNDPCSCGVELESCVPMLGKRYPQATDVQGRAERSSGALQPAIIRNRLDVRHYHFERMPDGPV